MLGILGINKRNLTYIKKRNPNKQIRLANNKYFTKKFLSQRGIPVPSTYAIIRNRKKLLTYQFEKIKADTFVVKPNKGSKGKGIFIVSKIKQQKEIKPNKKNLLSVFHKKKSANTYSINTKNISENEMKKIFLDIIDGQYTLSNSDTILIEEKIEASDEFQMFCEFGLADIRIICFNLVPIAAELRMPTKQSGGKANIAQGGIGFGIDITNGKITAMKRKNKIYHKQFPQEFTHFFHKKIPQRDEMLLYSSSTQYFTNIGFIGVDRVLTPRGPKLLEINARAGLEIQNITLKPLENYMKKVSDINIVTPEKGVEIAKSLFTSQKTTEIPTAKTLYLSQQGKLNYQKNNESGNVDVITTINTKKKRNYISKSLAQKLKQSNRVTLELNNSIKIYEPNLRKSQKITGNRIELGTNTISNFYIKPIHKSKILTNFIKPEAIIQDEIDQLQILDQKLYDIIKKISLSKILKPVNYLDEFDRFITRRGKYNPLFKYSFPTNQKLLFRESEITKLREAQKKGTLLKSPFANIFYEKIQETQNRIALIKAYKKQNFDEIQQYNQLLYGAIDEDLAKIAHEKTYQKNRNSNTEPSYGAQRLNEKITEYLKMKNRKSAVKVTITPSIQARIHIALGKNATIKINSTAHFTETDVESILAHEIDTHLQRYLNGKQTGRHILRKGTAYYQQTEEGLAIYNARKALKKFDPNYENQTIYINYHILQESQHHNFQQIADLIRAHGLFKKTHGLNDIFRKVTRFKKGIQDTKVIHAGAVNYKNKIYLDGFEKIKKIRKKDNLYIGKMKIDDLKYVK